MIFKRPSGSKTTKSIGVRASNNKNPESENDDNPLRASKMKDLKQPAKSFYQNELNLEDGRIASEEDYHTGSLGRASSASVNHAGPMSHSLSFMASTVNPRVPMSVGFTFPSTCRY